MTDFKGNRYELRLSLLEAFTSYLVWCESVTGIGMLREKLENPGTHKVNAYKVMDGEATDLYYQERNVIQPGPHPAIREYRMARATEGGWLPCFPEMGGWSEGSPKKMRGVKWGYWRVPLACVDLGGKPGKWDSEIKNSLPDPKVFMAIEMMKIIIAKLGVYRHGDDGPGEYGAEILDFFADEAHIQEPLWDLYLEVFGLHMGYRGSNYPDYHFPDSGPLSVRLCVLMDRFHGRVERRIAC